MNIPEESTTRIYEFTYLLPASLTSDKLTDINTSLLGQLKSYEFEILKQEEWGKKDMAYTIQFNGNREDAAHYYHFVFAADTQQIKEFEQYMQLHQDVMRYLLVVANEQDPDKISTETA